LGNLNKRISMYVNHRHAPDPDTVLSAIRSKMR
jgi:hypothetical protein